jgi:hypothetical protein
MENRGLKFPVENGILIEGEAYFFVVIVFFSGIMQYLNFAC